MTCGYGASRPGSHQGPLMSTLYVRNGTEFREATAEEISSQPTLATKNPQVFHVRHLLVGTHQDLRIQGRWFERAGFSIGARVSVRVFNKRLIIDVVQEPPQVAHGRYRRSVLPSARA